MRDFLGVMEMLIGCISCFRYVLPLTIGAHTVELVV
jgi:hypothetical protein